MPELIGVDLEDSWVLGWRDDPAARRLTLTVEASLWPGHPAYAPPLPGEYTCYRVGALSFEDVRSIQGLLEQSALPGYRDADGTVDYGSIDTLDREGDVFRLVGEMGDVTIHAVALRLDLSSIGSPAR